MTGVAKLSALAVLVVAVATAAPVQEQAQSQRVATIRHVMEGIVHPSYLALEEATKNNKMNARTAHDLSTQAALLNEASFLLLDNDRSHGKDWDKAVEQLRDASARMLHDLKAHDKDNQSKSLQAISNACQNCHAAHR